MALTVAAERYPRYGYKRFFQVLRRQGNAWNHKRVHRIYFLLKLNFRRKGKQHLPVRNPAPLATPEAMNQSWSIDFMHDALVCGRRFRTFNVVDGYNREALAIEIDLNIPAQRVVRVLGRIVANRGYPLKMRMDNGPELVLLTLAQCRRAWCDAGISQARQANTECLYRMIQPDVPDRNTGFLSVQNPERST